MLLQSSFCSFYQLCESSSIVDSQVSQNLAVQHHTSLVQASDEAAVAQAVSPGSSVDTSDPQLTESAFLSSSVAAGLHASLLGTSEAFSQSQNVFMTSMGGNADFNSCHCSFSSLNSF